MADLTIITNNVPRPILNWWELTDKERSEFEYIKDGREQDAEFVRYKGQIYDLGDMQICDAVFAFEGWDAYVSDTFFSGVLARFFGKDGELIGYDNHDVVMGRFYC